VGCVFQGNSQNQIFGGASNTFVLADCVFDVVSSGQWSTSGTGNMWALTTATVAVAFAPCLAADRSDFCPPVVGKISARFSLTKSCDVVIREALFEDLVYTAGSGGAVYVVSSLQSLSIASSRFDGCEAADKGGAVFTTPIAFELNDTCFSYCFASGDGQFVDYDRSNTAHDAICHRCFFHASFRKGERTAASSGDAFRAASSTAGSIPLTYFFQDDNHTLSVATPVSLNPDSDAAVDCDTSYCVVNRCFSSFENCTHGRILWIANDATYDTVVEYTNFLWNTATGSLIICSQYGFPIRHCLFVGNSPSVTFSGGSSSSPFVMSNCFFDSEPVGSIALSDGNTLGGPFTTAPVGRALCPVTASPVVPTASFTVGLAIRDLRRTWVLNFAGFLFLVTAPRFPH
jgi:hypothetical protein